MHDGIIVRERAYRPQVVTITHVRGNGSYHTNTAGWREALLTDINAFVDQLPTPVQGGRLWFDFHWDQADPVASILPTDADLANDNA